MAILVTGGAGYIGSHTCLELLVAGYEIIVVDNLINSNEESLKRVRKLTGKKFKFYNIDMLDGALLEKVFIENKIDAVIHFAGLKAVGESVQSPIRYYLNNITITLTLCEVMQKYNVKRMVFSSSATVYGITELMPINENSPLEAMNPYGRTKLMIESILKDLYISDRNWSITILRYFNPVGAHPSSQIGEDPNGMPNNLMPYITQVAIGKLKEFRIFGNDYPTIDGTGVRDYIHVVDLALGHLKAIEKAILSNGVNIYNLGAGKGHSVLEVIRIFEKVSGQKIPYNFVQRRQGDVAICYANPILAKVELDWTAKRKIEEMCADAWRWQLNNPNGYIKESSKSNHISENI